MSSELINEIVKLRQQQKEVADSADLLSVFTEAGEMLEAAGLRNFPLLYAQAVCNEDISLKSMYAHKHSEEAGQLHKSPKGWQLSERLQRYIVKGCRDGVMNKNEIAISTIWCNQRPQHRYLL